MNGMTFVFVVSFGTSVEVEDGEEKEDGFGYHRSRFHGHILTMITRRITRPDIIVGKK